LRAAKPIAFDPVPVGFLGLPPLNPPYASWFTAPVFMGQLAGGVAGASI
jgi:hypothetical protein